MKTIEYHTIDKSAWGPGPWQDEPDKKQWQDVETGLPCLAVRTLGGYLCGYVGVPNSHPWHGLDYSSCSLPTAEPLCDGGLSCSHAPEDILEAHGGITFSGACQKTADNSTGVCHLPSEGEPDDVWWFGFDCAHSGDLKPGYATDPHLSILYDSAERYASLGYVEHECAGLAKQLKTVVWEQAA